MDLNFIRQIVDALFDGRTYYMYFASFLFILESICQYVFNSHIFYDQAHKLTSKLELSNEPSRDKTLARYLNEL
jgi:hypothetical protein